MNGSAGDPQGRQGALWVRSLVQRFIVLSEDQEGIALVPAELFEEKMRA